MPKTQTPCVVFKGKLRVVENGPDDHSYQGNTYDFDSIAHAGDGRRGVWLDGKMRPVSKMTFDIDTVEPEIELWYYTKVLDCRDQWPQEQYMKGYLTERDEN